MKKWIFFVLIVNVICGYAFAAQVPSQDYQRFFNAEAAKAEFEKTNQKLSAQNISLNRLRHYVKKLENLQEQAETCIDASETQLKALDKLLKSTKLEHSLLIQQSEYKYLQDKQFFYATQLSECEFYIYRSKEALVQYKEIMQQLSTHELLKRNGPLWKLRKDNLTITKETLLPTTNGVNGTATINPSKNIFTLLLMIIGIAFALHCRKSGKRWVKKYSKTKSQAIVSLVAVASSTIILLSFLGLSSLLFHFFYPHTPVVRLLRSLSDYALLFVVLFAVSRYYFHPPYGIKSIAPFSPTLSRSFHFRMSILLLWGFIGCIVPTLLKHWVLSSELTQLLHSTYITFLIGIIIWIVCLVYNTPRMQQLHQSTLRLIKIFFGSALLTLIALEWIGFHQLVIFILKGTVLTIGLALLAMVYYKIINCLYIAFHHSECALAKNCRHFLGVSSNKQLKEMLLIKYILCLIGFAISVVLFMKIWSLSPNIIDFTVEGMMTGITFVDIHVIPWRIVIALLAFSFIFLTGRLLATLITRKERFEGEEDTQIAMASIMMYITFAIAVLFALLIMGINFTGLAIIAGALSVGVGLGLQDIVNNFVSGIILLLEKPIKPGDRVIVGNTEGFVKKVRLRSTQIATLAKEDVIVPNAELIANQVTNYMFRNRYWRVVCKVGVAYGSDVDLVKRVLLDIGSKHPDVVQTVRDKPNVLFKNFGDSSLEFELWCVIHDVNKKFVIASELNFAINEAFNAHGIVIAFPQRDIHIKNETFSGTKPC